VQVSHIPACGKLAHRDRNPFLNDIDVGKTAMTDKCLSLKKMVAMAATVLLLVGISGTAHSDSETVTVFAAASTTNAVTEIGGIFSKRNPVKVRTSFASSSMLAKQIQNGAPADIYISANVKWMDYLEANKMIESGSRIDLLGNRMVLIVPVDSTLDRIRIAPGFDLLSAIGQSRIAMGDPDHVPAGIYGKQALEQLGVWRAVEKHVARSKDVRAALALVERGEAPVGLVYATDAAITAKVKVVGTFPQTSHRPIVYPAAVVAGRRSPATDRFMALLRSPDAAAVFQKHGFSVR
jgi:molybdate transport system substrate-binding protein